MEALFDERAEQIHSCLNIYSFLKKAQSRITLAILPSMYYLAGRLQELSAESKQNKESKNLNLIVPILVYEPSGPKSRTHRYVRRSSWNHSLAA